MSDSHKWKRPNAPDLCGCGRAPARTPASWRSVAWVYLRLARPPLSLESGIPVPLSETARSCCSSSKQRHLQQCVGVDFNLMSVRVYAIRVCERQAIQTAASKQRVVQLHVWAGPNSHMRTWRIVNFVLTNSCEWLKGKPPLEAN